MLGKFGRTACGMVALAYVSTQVASAATYVSPSAVSQTNTFTKVDPLVALSAFGTVQSRAMVCSAGAAAVAAGAKSTETEAAALAAGLSETVADGSDVGNLSSAQNTAPTCVLPIRGAVAAAEVPEVAVPPAAPPNLAVFGLPLLAVLAGGAAAAGGGGGGKGNLSPVSPD